jgi:hypothetical protein
MMRHDPKWATFNSAYINEKVQFHLQNAFLDEPTEDGLIKLFTHISLTRDPRASKNMVPAEVWRDLPPDPEIIQLEERRAALKGGHYRIRGQNREQEIRKLTREIASKRAQRTKSVQREYRKYYFYNRPTWDIEMEARGEDAEEYTEPSINLNIPERARLAEILVNQPADLSYDKLLDLRIQVAELMTALCWKTETVKRDYIRRRAQAEISIKEESPEPDIFPLLMERTQCPRCIGNEGQSIQERTFKYCRPAAMYDHFDREHVKELRSAKQISCNHPKCKSESLEFSDLNHFKNHIERVHGVRLRA